MLVLKISLDDDRYQPLVGDAESVGAGQLGAIAVLLDTVRVYLIVPVFPAVYPVDAYCLRYGPGPGVQRYGGRIAQGQADGKRAPVAVPGEGFCIGVRLDVTPGPQVLPVAVVLARSFLLQRSDRQR